ncbi:hypothetical protein DU002_14965 [Corallincola holothuriorum]|uniref:Uncharacterized protein n=2 Tax=Corallincola holothuriorum TaxID=2282215 RepID=A0A368N879_9GAMM|nr:hypothetical protein DU002_14965 [Corallincola holothuriorum]
MHIARYTVSLNENERIEQRLASMVVFAEDGVTKLKVKKQLECKLEDEPFSNLAARELEGMTPK